MLGVIINIPTLEELYMRPSYPDYYASAQGTYYVEQTSNAITKGERGEDAEVAEKRQECPDHCLKIYRGSRNWFSLEQAPGMNNANLQIFLP